VRLWEVLGVIVWVILLMFLLMDRRVGSPPISRGLHQNSGHGENR